MKEAEWKVNEIKRGVKLNLIISWKLVQLLITLIKYVAVFGQGDYGGTIVYVMCEYLSRYFNLYFIFKMIYILLL